MESGVKQCHSSVNAVTPRPDKLTHLSPLYQPDWIWFKIYLFEIIVIIDLKHWIISDRVVA